ncbi:MAG TPA: glycosyltransferase family 2 protein [Candidatus Binatia bacterium]|jgi:GT2 family glycosyltransferase
MEFSIIIATYERVDSLERLLSGISKHFGRSQIEHEIVVANNSRNHQIEKRIDAVVHRFQRDHGERFRSVREPNPGKCRAQNRAIRAAKGKILAFFDDDVEVTPNWLPVAWDFFRDSTFDAMQGPILVPPEMANDQKFLRAQRKFRTISFVQYRARMKEIKTLTGGNMAVRSAVFARIGLFNEQLGPGRSGISEDVEFAQRLIKSGGRIGYNPEAAVYHEVDWSRLTEEFFRQRHEQQGRSRLLYKNQSLASILPNLMRTVWTFGWYSLTGNERKKYRSKGRYFHYRAMLAEKTKRNTGNQA